MIKNIYLKIKKNQFQLQLQSMVVPGIFFLIIFSYIPMVFMIIAFKDYNLIGGIAKSPWVGLKYFKELFIDSSFPLVLKNTFGINLLGLLIGFPAPIILAILLNEISGTKYKKFVQTSTYIPYFFSWAVYGGIVISFLSPTTGLLNTILVSVGAISKPINFMAKPNYFWMITVLSGLIKGIGYSSIIYLAAISGVDQQLYEAAQIDGAGRWQKIWYITIPCISNTIIIMLIFKIAGILSTGIEQIMILQNVLNIKASETLDTYVYKIGITQMRFSYATAVGIFKSVVAVILLGGANKISKKITGNGLY